MSEYAKITDTAQAVALASKVARSYRAASGKVRTLTADAAYATEAAFTSGAVAKGSKWETAREYADTYGVAPATVTLWKRLGRSLVVGVTTDSALWQVLAFKSAANDKAVADAIMADGATVATITAAVATTRKPDGSRVGKVGGNDGTPNDGTDKADPKGIPVEVTDPVARVALAVALLDAEVKAATFDADGWAKVETALHKIITREVTILAKAADKAAKAAAAKAA